LSLSRLSARLWKYEINLWVVDPSLRASCAPAKFVHPCTARQVTFFCVAKRKLPKKRPPPSLRRPTVLFSLPRCGDAQGRTKIAGDRKSGAIQRAREGAVPCAPHKSRAARELAGGENLAARAQTPRAETSRLLLRCSACSRGFELQPPTTLDTEMGFAVGSPYGAASSTAAFGVSPSGEWPGRPLPIYSTGRCCRLARAPKAAARRSCLRHPGCLFFW